MEREHYFNLTAVLSNLSKELISDTVDNRRPLGAEDLLYGLFDIVPDHKFLGDNPYYKANDKKEYKRECNEIVKHFLIKRYKRWFEGKYKREGELILQFLFENQKMKNEKIFIVPDTMILRYKSNKKNIQDGKIILTDILNFWLSNVIKNEMPEEYQEPKTIEVQVPLPVSKVVKHSSSAADLSDLDWEMGINDDDYNDSDRDRYLDDDGSIYAFNERQDK
ncbi:hypothetical protein ABEW33_27385 [Priestia megaterium]